MLTRGTGSLSIRDHKMHPGCDNVGALIVGIGLFYRRKIVRNPNGIILAQTRNPKL